MPPPIVERILQGALREKRKSLVESEAKDICRAYGMPTPDFIVARNASDAVEAAEKVVFPVVLKIMSPDILHKSEARGVLLDLRSRDEVKHGYQQIMDSAKAYRNDVRVEGVLVQHMAHKGLEVIVGGVRDSQFGPTILFGLGGIFVEVLKDVTFRVAPLEELDSREMIREIHSYPVLKGIRGLPAADEEAIVRIIQATSRLMLENSCVGQIDLNPIMVYATGANIVDARVILTENSPVHSGENVGNELNKGSQISGLVSIAGSI
jgi:acyl-CoA synthetase (NDP forming)